MGGSDMEDNASVVSEPAPIPQPILSHGEGFKPTPPQPSFQAGSTPAHLTSRYMVLYNY